jgi:predicted MPP superfamily phosphohydrolase
MSRVRDIRRFFWSALTLLCLSLGVQGQQLTLPLHSGSVRFAAFGDMGNGSTQQYQLAGVMNSLHEKFSFDFVVMLGDNIYGGNTPTDFSKKFEMPYKSLLDHGVKFYASLGNHDNAAVEKAYKPFNMNGQQYYTYKKGNVQFFALDSNYMDPKEVAWLTKELQNSGSDWKICYFHHPLYSSAAYHGSSLELREILEPLLVQYGVQVVLTGHDHVYERIKAQKGIYYFVAGSGGELRRGNLRKTELTEVGYDQDQVFLLLEISGDELDFQAVSRVGKTVDSGSIHRNPKSGAGLAAERRESRAN